MIPRILIIAGSDSGGGAGIQADIKTVTMLGGHAMTAITAITAQNTLGVQAVMPVPAEMVLEQMISVYTDIGIDAIKVGMLGSVETTDFVADAARHYGAPIIFDPVMVATSGAILADEKTIAAFERLARVSALVTPNIPELAALLGRESIADERIEEDGALYAQMIGTPVLVKGGHARSRTVVDRLISPDGKIVRWKGERIYTTSTHGTGCSLASAIATGLGEGRTFEDAIARGIAFVRAALSAAPGLGSGHGPMGHALGVVPFDEIET
jgi:hydroxymethylpyrimidine/phosphomethylpyrimidine kinase